MNETDTARKRPIVLPCIAGLLCVLSLFLIGKAAPVFVEMYRVFEIDPLPPNILIISRIHWFWTLPLGSIIAAILIWGSRRWSRRTNLVVDVVCIVSAVTIFMTFAITAFVPVFDMRS